MPRPQEGVCIGKGKCTYETQAAIKVQLDDETEERWIPKSQVHEDSEVYSSEEGEHEGSVVVTKWFAEKEGLG